jgi:cell division protein FtsW
MTAIREQAPAHPGPRDQALNAGAFSHSKALIVTVASLTSLGLVAIYAASSLKGATQFGDEFYFLRKQAVAAAVGFAALFFILRSPFRWIERATLPLMALTVGLLALIFVPGLYTKVGGAERWLRLPGFAFIGGQPSELAKLALVLFLAKNLARSSANIESLTRGILPNFFAAALLSGLLLFQKDLGTPVLLFGVTVMMLYVAGISRKLIAAAAVAGVSGIVGAVVLEPYRMARLTSFLDPWATLKGGGFQIIQSFVAFQNGGLLGAGLGESKQKLFFLPEAHTDFILSVIGEELGLIGVVLILALFAYLCFLGFRIANAQRTSYRRFLGFGLTTLIGLEAATNMGVVMGLLPTKGMPLPYVSSGNSSLLVFLVAAAILAKLGHEAPQLREAGQQKKQNLAPPPRRA